MSAVIENGEVQNPAQVENAVLAGGLVQLNTQMATMAKMVKFLCDRYVLDHFDWKSPDFVAFLRTKLNAVSQPDQLSADTLSDEFVLNCFTRIELDQLAFQYIQFTHENADEQ